MAWWAMTLSAGVPIGHLLAGEVITARTVSALYSSEWRQELRWRHSRLRRCSSFAG